MQKAQKISGKESAEILKTKGVLSMGVVSLAEPKKGEEKADQSYNHEKFIPWFDTDNNFPLNIAERGRLSTTHSRILRDKVTYTSGDGFLFESESKQLIDKVRAKADLINAKGQSLEEVFSCVAQDSWTFGNAFFEVIQLSKETFLEHKDATCCRVAKDQSGILFSRDWKNYRTKPEFKPVAIPLYPNFAKVDKLPGTRAIVHLKKYVPGYFYYSLPDYYPAHISGWIDIDYHIPKYNLTRFHNQFRGSGILVIVGQNLDQKQSEAIKDDVLKELTGEGKNSKVIVAVVNDETMAPKWLPFDDAPEGAFTELQSVTNENIVLAHGWHPSLVVQQSGKLSNASDIKTAFEMVMNSVIKPEQSRLIAPFLRIFKQDMGFAELEGMSISDLTPVSYAGSLDPKLVLTIDEQRDELGWGELEGDKGKVLIKPQTKDNGNNGSDSGF